VEETINNSTIGFFSLGTRHDGTGLSCIAPDAG